jgi:hypothetical protein
VSDRKSGHFALEAWETLSGIIDKGDFPHIKAAKHVSREGQIPSAENQQQLNDFRPLSAHTHTPML